MLFFKLLFLADGTSEYGQAIRWTYLLGHFGKDPKASKKMDKIDKINFKKWNKINKKDFDEYLKVTRV
ncbi:hypothetical protein [Lysinibacillus sp. NPDC086135]|uniref:hypothetical protein n=1 Tax=Lysinibacillus sp. NPDC086135 TaxID=3364130 RepID=UPI00382A9BC6